MRPLPVFPHSFALPPRREILSQPDGRERAATRRVSEIESVSGECFKMTLVSRTIADIVSPTRAPLAARPTLFVHIRKGTFAPVRTPEISYCRRLCAISLIRRTGSPAHK